MADTSTAVERLKEARPPATDTFTYLTIVEKSLSQDTLPTLLEILQDADLTNDIGWDLVEMLIPIPGSEECLETIARLGNPREVILKVLEVLERTSRTAQEEEDLDITHTFITLVGMLGILHKRLEVRAPSRFLHATLQSVYHAYEPNAEMTAAVIELVRALSGQTRPPLPTRKSSTALATPFQSSDPSTIAPDPEAEQGTKANPVESSLMSKLLQTFVTCIMEAYINSNEMEWSSRLLEFYSPERIVPGRLSMTQAFREDETFLARDALVGQLVALATDLGISGIPRNAIPELCRAPISRDPLATEPDPEKLENIQLSTGGFLCLIAYWIFASELFGAHYDRLEASTFPDHFDLLRRFLADQAQAQITANPGTVEALLVIGLWLDHHEKTAADDAAELHFMQYHHLLTLISVFHPSLQTRNVATTLAGHVLHSDPNEDDRLKILEDLLENCIFASLQACAVTWLKEELIASQKLKLTGVFSSPDAIDAIQYSLFPNVSYLKDMELEALWEYWLQNHPFHLQVANFAYLLFAGQEFKHLVPEGMPAAVEQRYVEPLIQAAKVLQEALDGGKLAGVEVGDAGTKMQLGLLIERLQSLPLYC